MRLSGNGGQRPLPVLEEIQDTGARTSNEQGVSGPELISALEQLVYERYPEGVVDQLERRYGRHGTAADDAVGDALETMV